MRFLIKNSNVVFKDCIKKKDMLIENGVICKIEDVLKDIKDTHVIDGKGLFAMPGIFDLHVHLRDPGFPEKETIKTGAKAAAAAGVTSIACMANTKPAIDSCENLKLLCDKIKKEKIHIYPIAAITKNLQGKELVDFKALSNSKAYGFSDDGFTIKNAKLMKIAMKKAAELNLPIFSHCEDVDFVDGGVLNEGAVSRFLKFKGIDDTSESLAIAREVTLSFLTDCPIHICHVSSFNSVLILKYAKKIGVKVTAETCPHYFMLTEKETLKKDANFKMNPPLKTEKDKIAVENALLDGTIDIIATDHAPHEKESKKDFKTAANGVIGLETSLSCTLTHFYKTKKMDLPFIAKVMCKNPAKILKIKDAGEIFKGAVADIILVDVNRKWTVTEENLFSKSKNSPFIGRTLYGKVIYTFCSGKLIFKYNF